ncbi:hypothetical protein [Devosia sp. Leaf64]|uniref:hypothetical protein n=1 Tax=Devosia sp. Leaf64 TaxID=1736229 RepID=UPI0007147B30|nr:hypothetical protein [Devosia sp. Leaf64]KQN77601.1 hypothetical protein ASE94_16515 [Devosia sp. Leaf64]
MKRALFALCCLFAQIPGASAALAEDLDDFLVGQGCAIGPETTDLAVAAGFSADALSAVVTEAEDDPETFRTGDWIVLPPTLCVIAPPAVKSQIRIDDPEVVAVTSGIDDYAKFGERGCFLDGPGLPSTVQQTRGWDAETTNTEYMRFLAENLRAGTIAFFKDDPLSTPVGIQVLTGECADVPNISEIRANQALRDRYFDDLIRENATKVGCEEDGGPGIAFMELAAERTKGKNTNAWLFAEVRFIAMGAGWYAGMSATERGTPRPPLCNYETPRP